MASSTRSGRNLCIIRPREVFRGSLEFKRALPGLTDAGKVKFLREVTAFANTQGGDLIYGMAEAEGIAHELRRLELTSQDQVRQRLESLCADGVEPRLTGLVQFRFVPLGAGGEVLVVRVAKSWNPPHRVTSGGHTNFYGRSASGSYPLDVGELRQSFTLSQTVVERIRAFRADRLLRFGAGDTPVPLVSGVTIMLHVVPLQSMTTGIRIDIAAQLQTLLKLSPPSRGGHTHRINLDGYLAHDSYGTAPGMAYAQLFRNGVIEALVTHGAWGSERILPSIAYEREIIAALGGYLPLLGELGLAPPAFVFLSLLRVAGVRLSLDAMRFDVDYHVDRDDLILPDVSVEDWSTDAATVMRPAFDMVWNAFGLERSFNYDQGGRWNPRG